MKIISIIHCIFRLATDKEKSDTSDIRTKGHKILISLFSHNRIDVRKYTYNSLKVCHKYLCVKYTSSQCMYISSVHFLLPYNKNINGTNS